MPEQRPEPKGEIVPLTRPLDEQDRIDFALVEMATRLDRTLTERIIEQWHKDLRCYPIAAIEFALDWCGTNLDRWPKLKQVRDAIGTWMGTRESGDGQVELTPQEISRRRKEFFDWFNSPAADEVRQSIRKLDDKMRMNREVRRLTGARPRPFIPTISRAEEEKIIRKYGVLHEDKVTSSTKATGNAPVESGRKATKGASRKAHRG
jgi:hypothetical protein